MTFPEFADGARGRNRLSKNPEVSPARLRRTNGTGTRLGSQVRTAAAEKLADAIRRPDPV